MRFAATITLIIVLVFAGCDQRGSALRAASLSPDEFAKELEGWDFSPELSKVQWTTVSTPSSEVPARTNLSLAATRSRLKENGQSQGLSPLEEKRLGVYSFDGGTIDYSMLPLGFMTYYHEHGVLPTSALDLVQTWLTPEGIKQFNKMTEHERFTTFAAVIDPLTGHLYKTYKPAGWEPLAISLEIVPKAQWGKYIDTVRQRAWEPKEIAFDQVLSDNIQEGPVKDVLHMVVYGEKPGTKLIDTTLLY